MTTSVDGVDDKTRTLYFTAAGREKGEDPYYTHLYRVGLRRHGLKLLNPGDASHAVAIAESNALLRRQLVARRRRAGIGPLRHARATSSPSSRRPTSSALKEAGFKFPEPFTVKADDGVTDLYGVMYKPFDFDPKKKYPIIAYVYPGPQTESVTKTFNPRSNNIVARAVRVHRHRSRQPRRQPAAVEVVPQLRLRQPARLRPGRQEGGDRAARAAATRTSTSTASASGATPAAASCRRRRCSSIPTSSRWRGLESGNHENNIYNNTWSEKHHGIKEVEKDGKVTFEYNIEKNSELAKNLKGHLMLVTGDIDNNVHPANTYRLADALIKANKRFDMFVLPGRASRVRRCVSLRELAAWRLLRPSPARLVGGERRHRRAQSRDATSGRETSALEPASVPTVYTAALAGSYQTSLRCREARLSRPSWRDHPSARRNAAFQSYRGGLSWQQLKRPCESPASLPA